MSMATFEMYFQNVANKDINDAEQIFTLIFITSLTLDHMLILIICLHNENYTSY